MKTAVGELTNELFPSKWQKCDLTHLHTYPFPIQKPPGSLSYRLQPSSIAEFGPL